MPLLLSGCIAPVAIALIVWLRLDRRLGERPVRGAADELQPPVALRSVGADRAARILLSPAGRWEGLSEEIAARGVRRPLRRSDAALRRRHLAAVLPADRRR